MESFSELELEHFVTKLEDYIGIFRINRPPANAHNLDVLLELQRIVEAVRFDPEVRVAVLGSANDTFFSTGFDIQALNEEESEQIQKASQTSKEIIMKMRTTDTLFLAMVNGHCMGGGLELALGCDFRFIGNDDDYRIGIPEVNLGLIAGEAGTQLLPRTIGRTEALRMMVFGEPITPQEAIEKGLFDEIHPVDELEDATMDFAQRLVELPNKAIGHNKLAVNEGMEMSLWDALAHERELQNRLVGSDIAKEGTAAFLGDHEPDFISVELGEKEPGTPSSDD
jgi:enoyl-CoA hydratase